jgi:hypothetical protein
MGDVTVAAAEDVVFDEAVGNSGIPTSADKRRDHRVWWDQGVMKSVVVELETVRAAARIAPLLTFLREEGSHATSGQ